MNYDPFSQYHPAVNFLYFAGVLGFGMVIQHPAYILASVLGAGLYCLLLKGRNGWRMILGMLPLLLLVAVINPLFNIYGTTVLFRVFGRPYTLEALYYGMAVAGIFGVMVLWFGCYSQVLTSDKFTSLFGNLIPALSLLLVMVLRLVPNLIRKARQITGARRSLGLGAGEHASGKEKLMAGITVLSALTDWALEGSIVTADSMRSRGYGSASRTSFRIYRMTARDWSMVAGILMLGAVSILFSDFTAAFTPDLYIAPLGPGFGAYCVFLLLPSALNAKEAVTWRFLRSRIR